MGKNWKNKVREASILLDELEYIEELLAPRPGWSEYTAEIVVRKNNGTNLRSFSKSDHYELVDRMNKALVETIEKYRDDLQAAIEKIEEGMKQVEQQTPEV